MQIALLVSIVCILAFVAHGILNPRKIAHGKFYEMPRQIVHALVGLGVIAIALFSSIETARNFVLVGLIVGIAMSLVKTFGFKIFFVDKALFYFERPGFAPGYGAVAYFAGMLFALSYCSSSLALYVIYIMAVCDAAATIYGRAHGLFKLPYNKNKSFEGLLAFLAFAMPVVAIGGSAIVPVVIVGAILETIDIGIDDNVLVPFAGLAYGLI